MLAPTVIQPHNDLLGGELQDLIDGFDLDIRITVQPDPSRPDAHFSDWQTCKSSCVAGTCTQGYTCNHCSGGVTAPPC